jgi:hypothetical protein
VVLGGEAALSLTGAVATEAVESDREFLYDCFLADQPSYLAPERLIPAAIRELDDRPLRVSPNVWFSWREELPQTIRANYPLPRQFLQRSGILWVEDPLRGMQTPFWAGPWFQGKVATLTRRAAARNLSRHHRWVLRLAGVLTATDEDPFEEEERWRDTVLRRSDDFRRNGFASVQGLIHPFHIGSLRRYYRRLLRTGGMKLGDSSSPRRFVAHNESVATFFHRRLAGVVGAIAGRPVKPSYVYVSAYQSGADLPPHTDRAQCEYSITLLLDQTPEPTDQSSWPLYLNTSAGTVAIWQGIGDALIYRGRQLEHFRTPLPQGMSSTSMFFHYVDPDFSGPLD